MQLALIPPYAHINSIRHTDYQLLLPQCLSDIRYRRAYERARREGDFLILDNGAAEGVETSPEDLMATAREMMVNEVVIPDVIRNTSATIARAQAFEEFALPQFSYMAVVQGASMQECYECIDAFGKLRYITTLGIPRHLLSAFDEHARVLIVNHIRKKYDDHFKIHLLGTNPHFIEELSAYGQAYRTQGVRGVDTSAAFTYAFAGVSLLDFGKRIDRPSSYFEQYVRNGNLAFTNIVLLKEWVHGVR